MAKRRYLLSIHQGTTGTHVLIVDDRLEGVGEACRAFTQQARRVPSGHLRERQSGMPSWSPSGLAGQSTQRSARVSSYASFFG